MILYIQTKPKSENILASSVFEVTLNFPIEGFYSLMNVYWGEYYILWLWI